MNTEGTEKSRRDHSVRSVMILCVLCVTFFVVSGCKAEPKLKVEPIAKALTCGCPKVAVEGVLENRSDNYFANAMFVLKDSSGEVEVMAWLPLEVAPAYSGTQSPETMANYLGMTVRLIGRIDPRANGRPIMTVEYAERVE